MTHHRTRNLLPSTLVLTITAACAASLTGCSNEKPPPDPALMALANTPATPRDPSQFAGDWTGQVQSKRTSGKLNMSVQVEGDKFSGTLTTSTADFTVRGTIVNSTYTGVVTKHSDRGVIGSYEIEGMWSPKGMTINFEGGDVIGTQSGYGFLSKVEPKTDQAPQ